MKTCKHCQGNNTTELKSYVYHNVYECQHCNRLTYQRTESCCKDPFDIYVFKYNGTTVTGVHIQCRNCGGCMNMTKPLPIKQYGNLTKGEFSNERQTEWKVNRQKENDEIYIADKVIRDSKFTFYQYQAYLQSEHWRSLRLLVLERDNWLCQSPLCKPEKATDVHHLSYENLGNESLDELISYCRNCHKVVHGI